ncbi:hypothetical protein [Actinophytocola xinjiangensis]|uniref:hypothetical protein n=1 Tax=Actinophytocola xinjiangensis TaxID=485602 RepID=UPI000A4C6C2E|nr:hypothetical protein [Actinophytocola xinjiangensis]
MSSPVFGELESSLAGYLTDVTKRTRLGDDRSVAALARAELPRLVVALRAVLDEHSPDSGGRCSRCRRRRFGRVPSPCRAYLTAHLCLVAVEETSSTAPSDATVPMRRPVVVREVLRASG